MLDPLISYSSFEKKKTLSVSFEYYSLMQMIATVTEKWQYMHRRIRHLNRTIKLNVLKKNIPFKERILSGIWKDNLRDCLYSELKWHSNKRDEKIIILVCIILSLKFGQTNLPWKKVCLFWSADSEEPENVLFKQRATIW